MYKEHSTCSSGPGPETVLILVDMLRYFVIGSFPGSEMDMETALLKEITFMNVFTLDIFKMIFT